jgi:hypothetical protein
MIIRSRPKTIAQEIDETLVDIVIGIQTGVWTTITEEEYQDLVKRGVLPDAEFIVFT